MQQSTEAVQTKKISKRRGERVFAIPHSIMERNIRDIIKRHNNNKKVSRAAFRVVHFETEKFLADLFEIGRHIAQVAGKSTLQAPMLKAAVKCQRVLVPTTLK